MRDIQSALQERATNEIKGARAHYEKMLQQVQNERDARISDLKSGLAMIAQFMELEERFTPPVVPASPLVALADRFMRKLSDTGPMSTEELIDMAVKEGFFPDAENAAQSVHPMLVTMLRGELIRELPNGTYAPPTMSQVIKLRRVG